MTATAIHPASATPIEQDVERILAGGVTLAGRRFRALGATTFEHDAYLMQALADSKLLTTLQRFDPLHQELDDLSSAIIIECFRSGKLFAILAGVLVEDGAAWSPATAARTADFFASLSDPADKAALRDIIPFALLNFFLNVDGSWRVFRSYSTSIAPASSADPSPSPHVPPRQPAAPVPHPTAATRATPPAADVADRILASVPIMAAPASAVAPASAAPVNTTSAPGTSSSARSPGSTSTDTPPSPAGPSARD
jgi:hypothetical protein